MDVILAPAAKSRNQDRSPMTEKDIADIKDLYEDLVMIGKRAQERGVKLIIDSEYRYV